MPTARGSNGDIGDDIKARAAVNGHGKKIAEMKVMIVSIPRIMEVLMLPGRKIGLQCREERPTQWKKDSELRECAM